MEIDPTKLDFRWIELKEGVQSSCHDPTICIYIIYILVVI